MSCHYSCASCSGSQYFDLCTACPSTRFLLASTCPCATGYYEFQTVQCTPEADAGLLDSFLLGASEIAFYVAICLHLLAIVFTMNRLLSPKAKKVIDTLQVIGLVSHYRFVQEEVAAGALKAVNAFNFNYLQVVCEEQNRPMGCLTFENLIGPGLSILGFMGLFLLSYLVAGCIWLGNQGEEGVVYIRKGREEVNKGRPSLSLGVYWEATKGSLVLLYLDQTIIQTLLAISRVAISSWVGVLLAVPFLLLMAGAVRLHFTTINSSAQTTLLYRAKHSYFFLYDRHYHLNYIDHLFQGGGLQEQGGKRQGGIQAGISQASAGLRTPFYP